MPNNSLNIIMFFQGIKEKVVDFFSSPPIGALILLLKVIAFFLSVILIFLTIILAHRANLFWRLKEFFKSLKIAETLPEIKLKIEKEWEEIEKSLESEEEAELKISVIEVDKVFDNVLKRFGIGGADLASRLRQLDKNQISNIDDIWWAHKIRNLIVHEPGYHLSKENAKKIIIIYKTALKELEAL